MPKFIKKVEPIQASQWNSQGDPGEYGDKVRPYVRSVCEVPLFCEMCGKPLVDHGKMSHAGADRVCPGDWITEIDGEFSRWSPANFEATYEAAE